jgi:hypothetical protein
MKCTKAEIKDALTQAVFEATGKTFKMCRHLNVAGAILLNHLEGTGRFKAVGSRVGIKYIRDSENKIGQNWSFDLSEDGETGSLEHYYIINENKINEIIDFYGATYRPHYAELFDNFDFAYEPDPLWERPENIPERYRKFWTEDLKYSWSMNPNCAGSDLVARVEIANWRDEMASISARALELLGGPQPEDWEGPIRSSFRSLPKIEQTMSMFGARSLYASR